ncbi:MAG: hypothetical protein LBL52_03040 [Rickettsiales bacterium]|jgi:hypothetical protein|nr:hypothetical protein [Rickettsiales bacterium]
MTAKAVQLRRGTAQEFEGFTGLEGEITYDKDLKTIRVHDETTLGGIKLARADHKHAIADFDSTLKTGIARLSFPTSTSIGYHSGVAVGAKVTAPANGYFCGSIFVTQGGVGICLYQDGTGAANNNGLGRVADVRGSSVGGFCTAIKAGQSIGFFGFWSESSIGSDKYLWFIPADCN